MGRKAKNTFHVSKPNFSQLLVYLNALHFSCFNFCDVNMRLSRNDEFKYVLRNAPFKFICCNFRQVLNILRMTIEANIEIIFFNLDKGSLSILNCKLVETLNQSLQKSNRAWLIEKVTIAYLNDLPSE